MHTRPKIFLPEKEETNFHCLVLYMHLDGVYSKVVTSCNKLPSPSFVLTVFHSIYNTSFVHVRVNGHVNDGQG